jgi:hypothetical protein
MATELGKVRGCRRPGGVRLDVTLTTDGWKCPADPEFAADLDRHFPLAERSSPADGRPGAGCVLAVAKQFGGTVELPPSKDKPGLVY